MHPYSITRTPAIYAGPGGLGRLPTLVRTSGARSVVILADPAAAQHGHLEQVQQALSGVSVHVHVLPAHEPTTASVNAAAEFARAHDEPLVLGLGGGSALDTAKQVAAVLSGPHPIDHYLLAAHKFTGRRPLIAVPTTAGTGAEATRVCVVSDEAGRKLWTWANEHLPDAVILEPALTVTLPAHVTTASGLDTLVHAIEAVTSTRRNNVATAFGTQAIRLVHRHLPRSVTDPEDLEARRAMQEAALLAGLAFDNSALGIAHAAGHALGTLHHLPHGVAVAVSLRAVLEWNTEGHEATFEPVAQALGVKVADLPGALDALYEDARFAQAARRSDVTQLDASGLAAGMAAPENASLLQTNVRTPTDAERTELADRIVRAWADLRQGAPAGSTD